jgi:4-diphosphocytidyl-2-C-methyl-D-erythritol kinase
MLGRGDEIYRCEVPELHTVLVNPGVSVATRDVFDGLKSRTGVNAVPRLDGFANSNDLIEFLSETKNDLEAPALSLAPQIGEVLSALRACGSIRLARMSGSGATCFGLFDEAAHAQAAAARLDSDYPNWWVKPTLLAKADVEPF